MTNGISGAIVDADSGPLKRSFSQHVYRPDDTSLLPSNSYSVSNISNPGAANTSLSHCRLFQNQAAGGGGLLGAGDGHASNAPPEDRYAALSSLFAESNMSNSVMTTSNGSDQHFPASPPLASQSSTCSNLSKSMSSSSVMGPPAPVIPKPPSKQSAGSTAFISSNVPPLSDTSFAAFSSSSSSSSAFHNSMQRCKSYGSLTSSDLRMTPISLNSVGSSRGPSPLTIGFNDTVPLAVALQESISARFKGSDESRCEVQMLGSLKIAFPSGIVQV